MIRPTLLLLLGLLAAAPALAAPAPAPPAPPLQSAPLPDLWTVAGQRIDATADSALTARDEAAAQGRTDAFTKLYRRLTAMAQWPKQPQLGDNQLIRIIRAADVSNERRSITRYVADVTYHFNPVAVRQLLRAASIPFTEQRSRPVLVIPITQGVGYDPNGPWAMAWSDPALNTRLVPVMLPVGDTADLAVLTHPDLAQLDWAGVMPLVSRYNVAEVVVAIATPDGKAFRVVRVTPTTRVPSTFAYAQPNYAAVTQAIMDGVNEAWKTRPIVVATRATLIADVAFASSEDWSKIRAQLGAVKSIAGLSVRGLMLHEAEIELSYFGRPEQLQAALAQQNLSLVGTQGNYTLELGGNTANAQ